MQRTSTTEALLKERDVAARLNVSRATLRRWRMFGTGPAWCKLNGASVRYRERNLDEFVADSLRGGVAQVGL